LPYEFVALYDVVDACDDCGVRTALCIQHLDAV